MAILLVEYYVACQIELEYTLVHSVEALYSRGKLSQSSQNINASECNALTILSIYKCKYRYTAVTSILYMDVSI